MKYLESRLQRMCRQELDTVNNDSPRDADEGDSPGQSCLTYVLDAHGLNELE